MWLCNVDLASVLAEHLSSLATCVMEKIVITNVGNTNLTSILDSCTSQLLDIDSQSLSTAETLVLVWAMRKVEEVKLGAYRELTLNITTLVTYSGWGILA